MGTSTLLSFPCRFSITKCKLGGRKCNFTFMKPLNNCNKTMLNLKIKKRVSYNWPPPPSLMMCEMKGKVKDMNAKWKDYERTWIHHERNMKGMNERWEEHERKLMQNDRKCLKGKRLQYLMLHFYMRENECNLKGTWQAMKGTDSKIKDQQLDMRAKRKETDWT